MATRKPADPRKATTADTDRAMKQRQHRIDELITADSDTMLAEMARELGHQHQQIVADRVVINRLVGHVLALDPDGAATKRLVAEAQEQLRSKED